MGFFRRAFEKATRAISSLWEGKTVDLPPEPLPADPVETDPPAKNAEFLHGGKKYKISRRRADGGGGGGGGGLWEPPPIPIEGDAHVDSRIENIKVELRRNGVDEATLKIFDGLGWFDDDLWVFEIEIETEY